MPTMTVEEAQAKLPAIIAKLNRGEEILLTQGDRLVAKLVGQRNDGRPVFGRGRGMLTVVAEDDEHLQGFEEYLG